MRVGIDLVRVSRVAAALDGTAGFAGDTYTSAELACCADMPARRRAEFLAGRLAAKEAVVKALGRGGAERSLLLDIETLPDATGAPVLTLGGEALRSALALGAPSAAVSISHEDGAAVAVAILN